MRTHPCLLYPGWEDPNPSGLSNPAGAEMLSRDIGHVWALTPAPVSWESGAPTRGFPAGSSCLKSCSSRAEDQSCWGLAGVTFALTTFPLTAQTGAVGRTGTGCVPAAPPSGLQRQVHGQPALAQPAPLVRPCVPLVRP